MAEFDELRERLRGERAAERAASDLVAKARERVRRLERRAAAFQRTFSEQKPEMVRERARLQEERAAAVAAYERAVAAERNARRSALDVFRRFSELTDPRQGIARFTAELPILLLPVRLETRFKSVTSRPGAPPTRELWVRIFPDDCWVDGFDPTLTETEVLDARAYFAGMLKAGKVEEQERSAWRTLVSSVGTGRAAWIKTAYEPAGFSARAAKARADDVILVIVLPAALAPAEETALRVYWPLAWRADGAGPALAAARAALEAAVGAARAAALLAEFPPVNFADAPATGVARESVAVSVAFLVFAEPETKQSAWSRAPSLKVMPDRFVFLGESGGEQLLHVGSPVLTPLPVGPDPSLPEAEQLRHDAEGNLVVPEELRWLTDFERAIEVGMGFRIPLDEVQASRGFERVLVVGLCLQLDQASAQTALEELLRHHFYGREGLALVPQGTPTNNTEAASAGYQRLGDADQAFDDLRAPLFAPSADWLEKRDGQWVAEYLGVDPAIFHHVHGAGLTDQAAARALNTALWPATIGHWMESMMSPLFDSEDIERTRRFFTRSVLGGGAVPALRIGLQPYGILPTTAFSRMAWLDARTRPDRESAFDPEELNYLKRLNGLLEKLEASTASARGAISYVGKAGDPHQILLDILGLHPGSAEFSQRYAESLTSVYNRLALQGLGGFFEALALAVQRGQSRELLEQLGGRLDAGEPQLLNLLFGGKHHELRGGLVDDVPLSETQPIRSYTEDGKNYIEWLLDAARTSLDALYRQDGFDDDTPPAALLYLLLRHALQLGYHDVSVRLHESAGIYGSLEARAARIDQPFLHIREQASVSESRYAPLYAREAAITGVETQTVHAFISKELPQLTVAFRLREQLAALERLKDEPTARLARAFADHIDCGAYRLDAWRLGLVQVQLSQMRGLKEPTSLSPRRGVQLGAYAWLEELRPENKQLSPVVLQDPELSRAFETPNAPPLERDSQNQGYIHAPSLNHAVAAAVLRNGFLSNASAENRQTLAVNLTSERVRTALSMLEGIRGGQSLSDLLGYQFERGLHDRHGSAEVDEFVFKLRREFPLRADRFRSTKTEPGTPIESIEARNVLNGLAMVEHMKATGQKTYPFGKPNLPMPIPVAAAAAIDAEADRLLETHDAVADLALAEGVYQAVLGNYDRVASTYDAYARGNFPPEPDVVRTPRSGIGVTHRVALHLPAGQSPTVSPLVGVPMTPRAQAEPALNAWLSTVLPPPSDVAVVVEFRAAATGTLTTRQVTFRDLSLQPADIVALVRDSDQQAMGELDDRILRHTMTFGARPDTPIAIRYLETTTAPYSLFQVMPLVRSLRELTTRSRPLKPSDLTLANEATAGQDAQPVVNSARLELVRTAMTAVRADLASYRTALQGPLSDLENRLPELLSSVDQYIDDLVALLSRVASFNLSQAGWGFAYDFRARVYRSLLEQVQALLTRWEAKLTAFQALLLEEAALPASATDAERIELLLAAEQAISTAATLPVPASPAAYRLQLTPKRVAFEAKRDAFSSLLGTTQTRVSALLSDVKARLPVDAFDAVPFGVESQETDCVRFVEEALRVTLALDAELERRLAVAAPLFTQAATAEASTRVELLSDIGKALLGADFRIFPEFALSTATALELDNALQSSRSGELFTYLTSSADPARPSEDFPVDTWLYGVARVREKLQGWERIVMVSGSLGRAEPELEAVQLPFVPGDQWLGLDVPPGQKLDRERLLYTAHFGPGYAPGNAQCGMLLDEWSETIPLPDVDTGIAFHYDRPNTEAPQTFLLVTPTRSSGNWQWEDLVDALGETLELAKRRAIEPAELDATPLAPFAPSTIVVSQVAQLTIAANLALNNPITVAAQES